MLLKLFLTKEKITQTKNKLDKYSEFTEFRSGRRNSSLVELSERSTEVATHEKTEKLHDIMLAKRKLKISYIT